MKYVKQKVFLKVMRHYFLFRNWGHPLKAQYDMGVAFMQLCQAMYIPMSFSNYRTVGRGGI